MSIQAKLVKQEQQAIDAQYEKKRKGAEVAQKMYVLPYINAYTALCNRPCVASAQSTLTNKSRLRLLQQREEHLQDLFHTARTAIVDLAQNEGRYVQFLEGVIVQGLLQLLEPEAIVHARGKDTNVAEKAADGARRQYTEISGRQVSVSVVGDLSNELYVRSCIPLLFRQLTLLSFRLSYFTLVRVVSSS